MLSLLLTSLPAPSRGWPPLASAVIIVGLLLLLGFFSARLKKVVEENLTFGPNITIP